MGQKVLGPTVRMQEMIVVNLLVAILIGVALASPVHAQSNTYVNPVNARHTISIQRSPALFIAGDRAIDAVFCSSADRFVCVSSNDFNFAFPLNRASDVKKWDHRGYLYELRGSETLQVFGRSWRVWIVESVQGVKTARFAYSERRGVLAFSIRVSDATSTFLSVGTVGFGAQPATQSDSERK